MDIRVTPTPLSGVLIVDTDFLSDARGFFIETYHKRRYAEHGIDVEFVQDNHSRSAANVLRGIHYQDARAPMAKLVRCTAGRIWDVAVDLRVGSPSCGRWVAAELSAENMRQVFVPPGFGHGFLTLSDAAEVQYKCDTYYAPETEHVIAWDDVQLAIDWPLPPGIPPVLSERDRRGMSFRNYLQAPAFR